MTLKTKDEKEWFWEIHDRIEGYLIDPRIKSFLHHQQRFLKENKHGWTMIHTGRPNDTTAMTESNDITIVGDVPSTGKQPTVDRCYMMKCKYTKQEKQ